jgi:hypothetical protein
VYYSSTSIRTRIIIIKKNIKNKKKIIKNKEKKRER